MSGSRIFLIGPMGAGKSTAGKALALVLGMPFVDLDEELVRAAGRSIPEIFKTDGETGFRDLETATLKRSLEWQAVIATGGGVVMREENRAFLKAHGVVCYLYAPVDVQYQRTASDRGRPMLNAPDRLARLKEIFIKRDPLYRECAHLMVDSSAGSVHDCVRALRRRLKEFNRPADPGHAAASSQTSQTSQTPQIPQIPQEITDGADA